MNLIYIAAGGMLLFFGRKLFWLFVAVVGFLIGITFVPELFPNQPESVILIISLIIGMLGALLTSLLQKVAVAVAGLLAGGYIAFYLLQTLAANAGQYQWAAIIAGAIIGGLLAGTMFDWGLIILTSASGATLISQGVDFGMPISGVILVILFIIGLFAQINIKAKE